MLVGLIALSQTYAADFVNSFTIPGTESQRAADLLEDRFPARSGSDSQLVFQAEAGLTNPAIESRIEGILEEAATLPGVTSVASPLDSPAQVSADDTIGFATLQYDQMAQDLPREDAEALLNLAAQRTGDGLLVVAGGEVAQSGEQSEFGSSELIGLAAAALILLIAFGSVVAMGVPILTAVVSLGGSLALLGLLAGVLDLSEFTPSFAAMIGLGVGIDYALLVITRFREGIHAGDSAEDAVATAMDTAGRSVLFAGQVVIIAMLGLLVVGVPLVGALGIAAAIVVGLSVIAALTLLPAILGILGRKVDSWAIPFLVTREGEHHSSVWYAWSLAIQRRPLAFAIIGLAILLALASPVLDMATAFTDAGNNPPERQSRQAYDLLTEGFGPGFNGPLTVVVDVTEGGADGFDALRAALEADSGVQGVGPPFVNEAGDTAVITVYPTTAPQDAETNSLVRRLRDDVVPPIEEQAGFQAFVAGSTAASIDTSDLIGSRTPLFFVMVIGLSFLLLMAVFRSVFIPLKAAVLNLISVGAAYGVVVAVFQWGWGAELLGIGQTGPIESFLPMMLFAILFGLSMDYEVFLVSRIREEYVHGAETHQAIATGLASTARVISSAALIMIAVFGSFVLNEERVIKMFGLGLATAIFLDATVVRLLLVPSVMQLLGKWNWWLPSRLDRILPHIHVEAPSHEGQAAFGAESSS
jgi:RND superfamily putative drug exporter